MNVKHKNSHMVNTTKSVEYINVKW